MSNFITEFNTWSRDLLSKLQHAGIDYATIELKTGVNYTKSNLQPVQISVYTMKTQTVSGFDPEDVVREVEHRIGFNRQQESLRLSPPDAEFEVVPPAPSQAPDDDIPY